MHSYTIRAGLIRSGDAWQSRIEFPSRAGRIIVAATVPREAVLALRDHLRAALRDPSRSYSRSLDAAMRASGDEVSGIWDTLRGLIRTGISALPIPGAGLLAQGVDALGNVIQRRVSRPAAAPPRPAAAPAPAPAPGPYALGGQVTAQAAPAGLPGLAGLLAQLGLGGASPEAAMGALSGLASALQASRAAQAMPAPAPAPFSLFGGSPQSTLPGFLRGLVGASDAEIGVQLFDVVGGTDDPDPATMTPQWWELTRAARDPRVAEAFQAARALHAWMHEHPLRPVTGRRR